MDVSNVHSVYFIGIGGIGMSALARYFSATGKNVMGYDKQQTPITQALCAIGIEVVFEDCLENIPEVIYTKESSIIVYTPAVSKEHQQLSYFIENNYTVLKRAEVLGLITKSTFCFGVAGTHGKTTTSSILGHIMQPEGATSFLGGIAENYNSNLILGKDKTTVVEADEFDRSFLHLSPNIACITSMDADHLDIYGETDALHKSFENFANKVSDTLVVAKGIPMKGDLTYAIEEEADYTAYDLKIKNGGYVFAVKTPLFTIENIVFYLPGKHNLMNALAAFAMADVYGVSPEIIKKQLQSFKGVQRRFSYKLKSDKVVLIDDYAHHPTEIAAVESAVREMYPDKKVLAVFQPHLYSRTRDFSEDFAEKLSRFDEVLLLDIYPAREEPIAGINSEWLLDKMTLSRKKLTTKASLLSDVVKSELDIIVMMGAGDIGLLVDKVKLKLEEKYKI